MANRKYATPGYIEVEYKNQVSLQDKINEYFNKCKDDNVYPDEAGMIIYLGICRDTLENYLSNENDKYKGFSTPIKNARVRRESMIVRDLYSGTDKVPTGKIFLAKQISNGGLTDKQEIQQSGSLNINIGTNNGDPFK